jgi:hypothetical protein
MFSEGSVAKEKGKGSAQKVGGPELFTVHAMRVFVGLEEIVLLASFAGVIGTVLTSKFDNTFPFIVVHTDSTCIGHDDADSPSEPPTSIFNGS